MRDIGIGPDIAMSGSPAEPLHRFAKILFDPGSCYCQISYFSFGIGVFLFRRFPKPLDGFVQVFFDAGSKLITLPEVVLRFGEAQFCRFSIPLDTN